MTLFQRLAFILISLGLFIPQAHAKRLHHNVITCNQQGCSDRPFYQQHSYGYGSNVSKSRPHARPVTFQGDVTITITKRHHGASAAVYDGNENVVQKSLQKSLGRGVICSGKTKACAHVSASAAPAMQAMLNDLEQNHGATVRFVGGIRAGRCSLGSQHPCGWAMDVCQLSRGVVDPRCNLPSPAEFHRIARAHGLYEGSVWCSTDYGHVQFKNSGGCNVAAHGRGGVRLATLTGKMVQVQENSARRHHHRRHIHIARR